MLRSSLRIYRTIQDRLSAGYCAHLPAGREGCQLRLSRAEAVPCRVGVATRNCCKMRCQTSHLTMQTGKWAACDFVYLFACDLHRATLFNCPPPPPHLFDRSHTVHLSVCWSVCPTVCLAVSQNGWAQGSRMLSKPALHLCVFLEDAAAPAVCASQTEASVTLVGGRGQAWAGGKHHTKKNTSSSGSSKK